MLERSLVSPFVPERACSEVYLLGPAVPFWLPPSRPPGSVVDEVEGGVMDTGGVSKRMPNILGAVLLWVVLSS